MGAARYGASSEVIAGLAGAEHAQHPHIAGRVVTAGVVGHSIQRPVPTVAGQLARA